MSRRWLLPSLVLFATGCATGGEPPAPQAVVAQPAQVAVVETEAAALPPVIVEKPVTAWPIREQVDTPRRTQEPTPTAKPTQAPSAPEAQTPDNTAVINYVLAQSRAGYSGSCACPDDRDRAGRRCGGRSAYSKPGGYAPLCYPRDVTQAMIEQARREMRL